MIQRRTSMFAIFTIAFIFVLPVLIAVSLGRTQCVRMTAIKIKKTKNLF